MSHIPKVMNLVATMLLFAGGIALAADPSTVPPRATKQPPAPMKPQLPAPFWILLPTANAKIVTGTGFVVRLKATTPPPGVYLQWQRYVSNSWQAEFGPTGANWQSGSELDIPIPGAYFPQPANYRVRATWDWGVYTAWRNFQIVPKVTLQTIPTPTTPPLTTLPSR